jgi:DNA-binding GntR family transcriptional regulator
MEKKLEVLDSYKTKFKIVYEHLKKNIQNGYLKPGQKLVITEIAKELDVSIMPVREAIKRLGSEGLVDILPHKVATVSHISLKYVEEMYEMRILLEPYAASIACEKISEQEIESIKKYLNKIEEYTKSHDFDRLFNANMELHFFIYQIADNGWLMKFIKHLWDNSRYSNASLIFIPGQVEVLLKDHIEIQKAFEKRDARKVKDCFQRHITIARDGVMSYLEKVENHEIILK